MAAKPKPKPELPKIVEQPPTKEIKPTPMPIQPQPVSEEPEAMDIIQSTEDSREDVGNEEIETDFAIPASLAQQFGNQLHKFIADLSSELLEKILAGYSTFISNVRSSLILTNTTESWIRTCSNSFQGLSFSLASSFS
jgi:hypothetical protein